MDNNRILRCKKIIRRVVNSLWCGRERDMALRYMQGESLVEVGREYGVSGERVRQIADNVYRDIEERMLHLADMERENRNMKQDIERLKGETMKLRGVIDLYRARFGDYDEEVSRIPTSLYSIKIEDTPASVRLKNCCMYQLGIRTVGELAERSGHEFVKCRNAGQKTYEEAIGLLKRYCTGFRNDCMFRQMPLCQSR